MAAVGVRELSLADGAARNRCGRVSKVKLVPLYSTSWNAAKEPLDWLAARGIVRLSNGDGDSRDCDFIADGFSELRCAHVTAETWPKAISEAIEAAKGVT